ncbi:MAG: hypothetical protein IT384_33910 [Deltaproteobacteria bacterium]|nr:hypothetical protein [Deltaproteobacteria bacterium]
MSIADKPSPEPITIHLTADEALVLGFLLSRFDTGAPSDALVIEHPAERAALWALGAALERTLVPPLLPDHGDKLDQARSRLCDQAGL